MNARRLDIHIEELIDIKAFEEEFLEPLIAVDCIFGTGFRPPLDEKTRKILEIIDKKSKITVACDIPSGVCGDTGCADLGSAYADLTVTFEYPKVGHISDLGNLLSGSVEVIPIGIGISPDEYYQEAEFLSREEVLENISRRDRLSHKKTYGHTLIAGGSPGMSGAIVLAAKGALRSGAGLVTCAVTRSIAAEVAAGSVSSMNLILEDGMSGAPAEGSADRILSHIKKRAIDALLIGPGLDCGAGARNFLREILEGIPKEIALVLDADALNILASSTEEVRKYKFQNLVLTPHPGEMGRLLNISTEEVQLNRIASAKKLSEITGATVILKGYRSLIVKKDKVFINPTGNPGLATGGSGDILAGMVASFAGQGDDVFIAAMKASWIHGRSADMEAWEKSESFILPEDIIGKFWKV